MKTHKKNYEISLTLQPKLIYKSESSRMKCHNHNFDLIKFFLSLSS